MPMEIVLAKMDLVVNNVMFAKRRDSQAASVMNANQILLVANVMHVNLIISIIHHVKVSSVCMIRFFFFEKKISFFCFRMQL